MRFPGELRNEIFSWVFSSTRITFGKLSSSRSEIKPTINKSNPNSLALLYACRQIHQETQLLWKQCVLFNFQTPEAMLDVLYPLPRSILSQIRHIRSSSRPILVSLAHDDEYYTLAWALNLLPDLCLDTLTVLSEKAHKVAGGTLENRYHSMDRFVEHGNGWRELQFIAPDSSMLGFASSVLFGKRCSRKPQPSDWNERIRKRDGLDSGASVTIYRSTVARSGAIADPRFREAYRQDAHADDINFGETEFENLKTPAERDKEMLIIVKRGKKANISEKRNPPFDANNDIRAWSGNRTWDRIRKEDTEGYDPDEELFGDTYGYGHGYRVSAHDPNDFVDVYGRNANQINWDEI